MSLSKNNLGLASAVGIAFVIFSAGELQAQRPSLSNLVSQIDALESQVTALEDEKSALEAQVSAMEDQISVLEEKQVITTYITGYNVTDASNVGDLTTRTLDFVKTRANSRLRITYNDNFRVLQNNASFADSNWQMKLDGNLLPIGARLYVSPGNNNIHRQSTVIGYVDGVSAGSHQLIVTITQDLNQDAFTGWNSSFLLQVEELPPDSK